MSKTFFIAVPYIILFTFFPLSSVMAHKVRVFAYESGGEIFTEAKFNNGRPAKSSTIIVKNDTDGTILVQGSTDDKGFFNFAIPGQAKEKKMTLDIIVAVGEGHKGSWLLNPSDYLEGELSTISPPKPQSHPSPVVNDHPDDTDYSRMEQIIEQALEKKLAPIKRMLAENREQKLTLRDILGGLGFIFGLAGMAAYFQSKKTGTNS